MPTRAASRRASRPWSKRSAGRLGDALLANAFPTTLLVAITCRPRAEHALIRPAPPGGQGRAGGGSGRGGGGGRAAPRRRAGEQTVPGVSRAVSPRLCPSNLVYPCHPSSHYLPLEMPSRSPPEMTQQNKVRVPTEWRVFYNMVTPSAISVVEAKSNFEVVSASWFVRPFAVASQ